MNGLPESLSVNQFGVARKYFLRSYRFARQAGLLSSGLGQTLYSKVYFLYKRYSEARQAQILGHLARPGTIAVDVGANIGYFTAVMAEAVGPAGTVLAFEPEEINSRLLQEVICRSKLHNVTLVCAALGDRNGTGEFCFNPDNPADHRIYRFNGHAHLRTVEVMTLDRYLDMRGDTREVSCIKIDVQGAELHALRGMRGTLARHPLVHLMLEFDPAMLREAGTDPREVAAFLHELGFAPFLLGQAQRIQASSWETVEACAKAEGYIDVVLSREPFLELT